jgi:hypothetical protein
MKHFTIFSENLTANTDNTFILAGLLVKNVNYFQINKVVIPSSFYTISVARKNNTLKVNSTLITIPDGTYSITDLCAYLQTQLVSIDASFTCTSSAIYKSVTIAMTSNFTIDLSLSKVAKALGFATTGSLTGASTYTSTTSYDPFGLGHINFHADNLKYYCESGTVINFPDYIVSIPVKTMPDDYIIYEPTYDVKYHFPNGTIALSNTKMYFTFRDGTIIDFRSVPFTIEFEFGNTVGNGVPNEYTDIQIKA